MEERLSEDARSALAGAEEEARRLGSGLLGTEHLLLGLLSDTDGHTGSCLRSAGATLEGGRSKVVELVGNAPPLPAGAQLALTDRARRTLERAERLSLRVRATHVQPEHVLASLLDVEGRAGQVLRGLGVDVGLLRSSVARLINGEPEPTSAQPAGHSAPRCSTCGSDLSTGALSHAVVTSRGPDGSDSRDLLIVYCSSCGSPLSAVPSRPSTPSSPAKPARSR